MNEKLSVELTRQQAERLRRAVSGGAYEGANEIFAEALDDWFAKRDAMASDMELLRRLCSVGIGSADHRTVDLAGIRRAARRRLRTM
jgi:Arc/MetJ-type ribon-helix-helix transcriptional regulator